MLYILVFIFLIYIQLILKYKLFFHLPFMYISFNLFYMLGLFYLTDFTNSIHVELLLIHSVGLLSFGVGSFFVFLIFKTLSFSRSSNYILVGKKFPSGENKIQIPLLEEIRIAWFFLIFSIFAGFLYYKLVGYNLFFLGVSNLLTGGGAIEDAATLRLAAYAGEKYFAPGYFNQFKNIIIVISWQYLYYYYRIFKKSNMLLFFTPLLLFLLLGTGQRGAFAYAIFSLVVFQASLLNKLNVRKFIPIVVVFVISFSVASMIIGRGVESGLSLSATAIQSISELGKRVFLDNPGSALYGFEFLKWSNIQPQNFKETLHYIKNILPFKKERILSIDSLVFEDKYGSTRGTAPLSAFAHVWYDARMPGVVIFFLILGISYTCLSVAIEKTPKNLFLLSCWSYGKTILALWASGSVFVLLNKGLLSIILLCSIRKFAVLNNIRQHSLKG